MRMVFMIFSALAILTIDVFVHIFFPYTVTTMSHIMFCIFCYWLCFSIDIPDLMSLLVDVMSRYIRHMDISSIVGQFAKMKLSFRVCVEHRFLLKYGI